MDYLNFVLVVPIFWALLSVFSIWAWSQHRKHLYLLWLAGGWFCTGLAQASMVVNHSSGAVGSWTIVVSAWIGAAALAQAMAMRFGRSVHIRFLAGMTALALVCWAWLPPFLAPHQLLMVSLALVLAHVLPGIWRLALRHRMERFLLACYALVGMHLLVVAGLEHGDASWWLGHTLAVPICAVVLAGVMVGCVWAESPLHLYVERDRDGLTGLLSRQSFEKACLRRPAEQHISFMVLCDIDHLQRVNQKFGSAVGDEVLRHFAQLLQANVRSGDLVGRLGGEEFGIALRNIDRANAQALVQRIIDSMAQQHWASKVDIGPLTASFGLTMVREDDTLDVALHRADVLLCQTKDAGGNRLTVEDQAVEASYNCYSC